MNLSLIAIMLGLLEMSVSACITTYQLLPNRVFCKTVKGRFDAEGLVRAVKDTVEQQGLSVDALLKDRHAAKCKV